VKRWSLSRRMTLWFAGTSIGLIVAISCLSGWFVYESVNRELDALTLEELDEMGALFSSTDGTLDDFAGIVWHLELEHPANSLAWRVWTADGELWGEFGRTELLRSDVPSSRRIDRTHRPGGGQRWRTESLDSGQLVGLVVDGSTQIALLRRYGFYALILLALSGGVAWLVAFLLSHRLTSMLEDVAAGARTAGESGGALELELDELPDEIRDVAEALAETLKRIRSESERANLMTAGLAHELRSPIQNLLGEAEVALMRERSPGEYRAVLESQIEEFRDLSTVVDNLVTLCSTPEPISRAEAEAFDLGEETDLRLDRDRARSARRNVELRLERSGDLSIRGDRESLLLALNNVVSNAIEWSPPGGTVRIALHGEDDRVEAVVEDQGPGIPPEFRERAFEPFRKGPARSGRRVGYGLGLALARTAVEMHAGTIDVDDAPDGGARLRIRLPRPA
jgi:two-component system heavy metal sensor histidine kinase CusS